MATDQGNGKNETGTINKKMKLDKYIDRYLEN